MMVASRGVDQANLALTGSVAAAASIAMEECSKQFAPEVWNCPVTSFRSRHDERQNNRETAYITAITRLQLVTQSPGTAVKEGSSIVSVNRVTADVDEQIGSGEDAVIMSTLEIRFHGSFWTAGNSATPQNPSQTCTTTRLDELL